ncbi:hypothetical protein [Myroides odoratus]|uniref:Lipoprotein n=1 Tax=Myroides odoratus TaxID=256 RepID=A0A9Q6Z4P9_MYROD|nr:hypothetical protein [Myroides odoratus]EHQ41255.1 hypothetical protein Myrod_0418 [Myroides odoratus DSM 2801]QQT98701.1 hypothetical protein I6I88_10750 [Myroides odoratus]WQD59124.1 hypothetical protein U0010_08225 [Myroides odoratus]STZ32294.1 Uncharacterised protein [Myroides odoratus]
MAQNSKLLFFIIFILFFSCGTINKEKYKIPDVVVLSVNNHNYEITDKNEVKEIINDLNKSRKLNDNIPIPYLFDIILEYKNKKIIFKSDGVYYDEGTTKVYPKVDLVKKYWNFEDADLMPKKNEEQRLLEK